MHASMDKTRKDKIVTIGIVIPVFNESMVLPFLIQRLYEVFTREACEKNKIKSIKYLFVDDGSTDDTIKVLQSGLKTEMQTTIIRLSRNFGQQAAISAGINISDADLIAVIDADLQDPPERIFDMVDKWREGYEVVYAQRAQRKENAVKVFCYWTFYRIYRFLSSIDVPLDSGDFCLMSRIVVNELKKMPESLRFPRGLRSWVGFPQTGIICDRPKRKAGNSKYSFIRLYKLATDGISSLSTRPLKVAQLFALLYLFASLLLFVFIITKMVFVKGYIKNDLALMIAIVFGNGLILFCLYIMGAYIGRAYLETKRRPNYIIYETMNIGTTNGNHEPN